LVVSLGGDGDEDDGGGDGGSITGVDDATTEDDVKSSGKSATVDDGVVDDGEAFIIEVLNEGVTTSVEGLTLDDDGKEELNEVETIPVDVSVFPGPLPKAPLLSLPEFPPPHAVESASLGELPFEEMTAPHGSLPMTLPGHPHRWAHRDIHDCLFLFLRAHDGPAKAPGTTRR